MPNTLIKSINDSGKWFEFNDEEHKDVLSWLDLTPIIRRLVQEDGIKGEIEAYECILEYKRFLLLIATHDEPIVDFVPSDRVWRVWNRHILDVKKYIYDCERLFLEHGMEENVNFLHHVPVAGRVSSSDTARLNESYEKTRVAYARMFCGDGDVKKLDENPLWALNEPGRGWAQVGCVVRRVGKDVSALNPQNVDLVDALARVVRDHSDEIASDEYLSDCESEYRRFLRLAIDNPLGLTPSRPVDLVWHEHILDTRKYQEDCLRLTGSKRMLLYHNPQYTQPAVFHESGFQRTRKLYEAMFGELPPDAVWNVRGESGGCEGCKSGAKRPADFVFYNCGGKDDTCVTANLWSAFCTLCHNQGACRCLSCKGCAKSGCPFVAFLQGPVCLASWLTIPYDLCKWAWCSNCACTTWNFAQHMNSELLVTGDEERYRYDERVWQGGCCDVWKFACCSDHDPTGNPPFTDTFMFGPPKLQLMTTKTGVLGKEGAYYVRASEPSSTVFYHCAKRNWLGESTYACLTMHLWNVYCQGCHRHKVCECIACRGCDPCCPIVASPPLFMFVCALTTFSVFHDCAYCVLCARCTCRNGCDFTRRVNITHRVGSGAEWYTYDDLRYHAESWRDMYKFICCTNHKLKSKMPDLIKSSSCYPPPKITMEEVKGLQTEHIDQVTGEVVVPSEQEK